MSVLKIGKTLSFVLRKDLKKYFFYVYLQGLEFFVQYIMGELEEGFCELFVLFEKDSGENF